MRAGTSSIYDVSMLKLAYTSYTRFIYMLNTEKKNKYEAAIILFYCDKTHFFLFDIYL